MSYRYGTKDHVECLLKEGDEAIANNKKEEAIGIYERAKFSAEEIDNEYIRESLLALVNDKIIDANKRN